MSHFLLCDKSLLQEFILSYKLVNKYFGEWCMGLMENSTRNKFFDEKIPLEE